MDCFKKKKVIIEKVEVQAAPIAVVKEVVKEKKRESVVAVKVQVKEEIKKLPRFNADENSNFFDNLINDIEGKERQKKAQETVERALRADEECIFQGGKRISERFCMTGIFLHRLGNRIRITCFEAEGRKQYSLIINNDKIMKEVQGKFTSQMVLKKALAEECIAPRLFFEEENLKVDEEGLLEALILLNSNST